MSNTSIAITTPSYFPAGQTSTIVPFDSYANLVIVQASVNGHGPYIFALDTAFPSSLIDIGAAKASGLGSTETKVVGFALKIDDLSISNQQAKIVSLASLPPYLGVKLDGILGADLFQRLGITVNYETRALTFTTPNTITPPTGSDVIPITVSPKGILAPIELTPQKGDTTVAYAKIDTGSMTALQLCDSYIRTSHILTPTQQELLVEGGFGPAPSDETMFVTRLGAVQIGRFEFKSPVTIHNNDITPHPYAAVIGSELLRRFTITFDLPDSRMYLSPNSSVHEPFLYDGSGLTIVASGPTLHTYTVTVVRPFSPAADAQIQPGDVLTSIDKQSADSLTLADIRQMLTQAGQTYPTTFMRAGKTHTTTLSIKWRV